MPSRKTVKVFSEMFEKFDYFESVLQRDKYVGQSEDVAIIAQITKLFRKTSFLASGDKLYDRKNAFKVGR